MRRARSASKAHSPAHAIMSSLPTTTAICHARALAFQHTPKTSQQLLFSMRARRQHTTNALQESGVLGASLVVPSACAQ